MKLKDFLKEFEGLDPESDMIFHMADGCCGENFELDTPEVDGVNYIPTKLHPEKGGYCTIWFPALYFLSSCRRSGAAQRAGAPTIVDNGDRHRGGEND